MRDPLHRTPQPIESRSYMHSDQHKPLQASSTPTILHLLERCIFPVAAANGRCASHKISKQQAPQDSGVALIMTVMVSVETEMPGMQIPVSATNRKIVIRQPRPNQELPLSAVRARDCRCIHEWRNGRLERWVGRAFMF